MDELDCCRSCNIDLSISDDVAAGIIPRSCLQQKGSPTNRPNHSTTQKYPKSNLAIKRPQNEENELIFVIYNLRLVILETLRVFQALWGKKSLF